MIVKIDADVHAGNPAEHHGGGQHESGARPGTGDAGQLRMQIEPKRAGVGREASEVEDDAVAVLRIGEKVAATRRGHRRAWIGAHNNFIAAITATTVMAKLTQGPQSMTPAMTASAKSGQKDLPTSSPACAI